MCYSQTRTWILLLAGAALLTLLGCAGAKPAEYQNTADEMKQGPGVLTGESGELTIYDSKGGGLLPAIRKGNQKEATEISAQAPESETKPASEPATDSSTQAREFQEFQEFQQWKNEKQEFREYQKWKKSAGDSADFKEFQEYRKWKNAPEGSDESKEFQQWKEWKSYQEWKKRKGQ